VDVCVFFHRISFLSRIGRSKWFSGQQRPRQQLRDRESSQSGKPSAERVICHRLVDWDRDGKHWLMGLGGAVAGFEVNDAELVVDG
jgi:hypothetical protein